MLRWRLAAYALRWIGLYEMGILRKPLGSVADSPGSQGEVQVVGNALIQAAISERPARRDYPDLTSKADVHGAVLPAGQAQTNQLLEGNFLGRLKPLKKRR
jgi:hypothetical protein